MDKIVILGAGLTGLSAGYHAGLKGKDYIIYEKENHVGGLSSTKEKEGFLFDFSGHLLHLKDPYFEKLIKELLGDNLGNQRRNSWIYSKGVFTPYPFQANLHGLPVDVIKECLIGFVRANYECEDLPSKAYKSFHDWIVAKLGEGIGKHFMFPYNEKIWTIGTEELTCQWLSEYVPRPSLEDVIDGSFAGRKKEFGYNVSFLYPKWGGIQSLADALAGKLRDIQLNEKIVRVDADKKTVLTASGQTDRYDRLITTTPLKVLIETIVENVPEEIRNAAASLRHNSMLILNLGIRGGDLTDKHWIYIPEKKFMPFRVGVYSNFSPHMAPPGTTSYYVEIAYQQAWNISKEQAIDRAIDEMVATGFIPAREDILVQDVADVDCGYVIYDACWAKSRKVILDYLRANNIHSIGRYGGWEYSGMEEALMQGKDIVDRIG